MKKLLFATVSVIAISATSAYAADMAVKAAPAPLPPPMYDWSGFYVGGNGGYGWGSEDWTNIGNGFMLNNATRSGGTAGGQFGWRTQSGWLVWGVDFQGNWADINGSTQDPTIATINRNTTVNSYETMAATAGYAMNNVLIYAKGGIAGVQSRFDTIHTTNAAIDNGADATRWGGMLGAGLEYGLTANWTIGVEYNHIFGGGQTESFLFASGAQDTLMHINQELDIVTARINYKFGGPVVARY
jgi:outer membrane immunogenic protein